MKLSRKQHVFLGTLSISSFALFFMLDNLETFMTMLPSQFRGLSSTRQLSISLVDGDCIWTHAKPLGRNATPYGTLLASYPGSGMRMAWQQTEGFSGIQVGDDFYLGGPEAYEKTGIVKTQYPHLEGIWSYQANIDQVIMLIRNPRWAIPNYHHLVHELEYSHDWQTAYQFVNQAFTKLSPMQNWIQWRDYRFEDEIKLWGWFIDFYMNNGRQYWITWDFERNGQWPFHFLSEEEMDTNHDRHCDYVAETCHPVALISYEKLADPEHGTDQIRKIANAIRGKEGMTALSDDHLQCSYHQTNIHHPFTNETDRTDETGQWDVFDYRFPVEMLETMKEKVQELETKYNQGDWLIDPIAQELVETLNRYSAEIQQEIDEINAEGGFPPTLTPEPDYQWQLVQWYNSLGRGNRYDKDKVQMLSYWWGNENHLFAGQTNPYTNETYPEELGTSIQEENPDTSLWGQLPPWWNQIPVDYFFNEPTPRPSYPPRDNMDSVPSYPPRDSIDYTPPEERSAEESPHGISGMFNSVGHWLYSHLFHHSNHEGSEEHETTANNVEGEVPTEEDVTNIELGLGGGVGGDEATDTTTIEDAVGEDEATVDPNAQTDATPDETQARDEADTAAATSAEDTVEEDEEAPTTDAAPGQRTASAARDPDLACHRGRRGLSDAQWRRLCGGEGGGGTSSSGSSSSSSTSSAASLTEEESSEEEGGSAAATSAEDTVAEDEEAPGGGLGGDEGH